MGEGVSVPPFRPPVAFPSIFQIFTCTLYALLRGDGRKLYTITPSAYMDALHGYIEVIGSRRDISKHYILWSARVFPRGFLIPHHNILCLPLVSWTSFHATC